MVCSFNLEPIFTIAKTVPKNIAHFKSGQKTPKNNHLAAFIMVESKSLIHSVEDNTSCWSAHKAWGEQNCAAAKNVMTNFRDLVFIGFNVQFFYVECSKIKFLFL